MQSERARESGGREGRMDGWRGGYSRYRWRNIAGNMEQESCDIRELARERRLGGAHLDNTAAHRPQVRLQHRDLVSSTPISTTQQHATTSPTVCEYYMSVYYIYIYTYIYTYTYVYIHIYILLCVCVCVCCACVCVVCVCCLCVRSCVCGSL